MSHRGTVGVENGGSFSLNCNSCSTEPTQITKKENDEAIFESFFILV
jgi:hypothetical protein